MAEHTKKMKSFQTLWQDLARVTVRKKDLKQTPQGNGMVSVLIYVM